MNVRNMKVMVQTLLNDTETVSLVLKAHLFTEHLLDNILLHHMGARSTLKSLDLTYKQKVSLVEGLGLTDLGVTESLRRLNRLRNRCVHTLNWKPTRAELRSLLQPLPEGFPRIPSLESPVQLVHRYMAFMCGCLSAPDDSRSTL